MYAAAVEWIRQTHPESFRKLIKSEIDGTERYGKLMHMVRFTSETEFPISDSEYMELFNRHDYSVQSIVEEFFGTYAILWIIRDSVSSREIMIRLAKLTAAAVLYNDATDLEKYGRLT